MGVGRPADERGRVGRSERVGPCPGTVRSSGRRGCSCGRIICSRTTATLSISSRARVRDMSPYPWGFSALEIDRDLAQQSKFALRRAAGVMPDGTPFDIPADSPPPDPIDVPDNAAKQIVWLSMPVAASEHARGRRSPDSEAPAATSRRRDVHRLHLRRFAVEEEIDVAYPRLGLRAAQDRQARLRRPADRADRRDPRQDRSSSTRSSRRRC